MKGTLLHLIPFVTCLIATLALTLAQSTAMVSAQGCSYQANVLADNPIAYWRLGETNDLTAHNIGSLGSAVDGSYQNGVGLGLSGLVADDPDLAAHFDGRQTIVGIPNHSQINTNGPYAAKTIELWFTTAHMMGKQVIYEQGDTANGLNIFLDGDQLYVAAWVSNTGSWIHTTFMPGVTYYVAVVFDGNTPTVTGYLNGVSFGSLATSFNAIPSHSGGVGIGDINDGTRFSNSESAASGTPFDGIIDEVALYNQALSAYLIRLHARGCTFAGPAVAVNKNGPATAGVGDSVSYSFTVTNMGDRPLQNVQVMDDHTGTAHFVGGDDGNSRLDLTEAWAYTASYTIQPTDPDPLMNTAMVTATDSLSTGVTNTGTHNLYVLSAQGCDAKANVLADNPIAYWPLGETSGPATNLGGLGDAVDGIYRNGVTRGVGGLLLGTTNWAAHFDGVDDYVSIPNHTQINASGPYAAKTIELRFKADAPLTGRQILYEEGGDINGLNIFLDNGQLYAGVWANDSGNWLSASVAPGIAYHVTLVFDGNSQTVTGYLNGASLGSQATSFDYIPTHPGPISIGSIDFGTRFSNLEATTGYGGHFRGILDEVTLYNAILSPERVQLHAQGCSAPLAADPGLTKTALSTGSVAPGEVLTYTLVVTTSALASNLTISDTLPAGVSFVPGSGQVTLPVQPIRATEYYIAPNQFTGASFDLALDQDLAEDYFVIIQGSDGDGVWDTTLELGPSKNYVALVADPFGSGDLGISSGPGVLTLQRGGASTDPEKGWVGVVTVVESLADQTGSGFRLLDVQRVGHSGSSTSGGDTSGTPWSDINQVMLMGGYNGAGCDTSVSTYFENKICHVRLYPSATNSINWTRDAGADNPSFVLDTATSTVMVIEWGQDWTVQRVRVQGSQGGDGADATDEYNTAALDAPIQRANTWVWGAGHTAREGIGTGGEGVLITLGDGFHQNATESQVAVGLEYSGIALDFEVYALTHPALQVDYRFKSDGNQADLIVNVPVNIATGNRMALAYNGQQGTGTAYPRPMLSARYISDGIVRLERRKANQSFPAWVQGIDFSNLAAISTQTGDPATLLGARYALGAGQAMTVTYAVALERPWRYGPTITNTASVTSSEVPAPTSSTVTNSVTTTPLINVVKAGPTTATVGDTAVFTFTVTNVGNSLVHNLHVEDDLAGPATGNVAGGDTNPDGWLDLTEAWVYTASYTIQPTDPNPLTNTVTATATDVLNTQVTVSDAHSTHLSGFAPALRIDADWPISATVSQTIVYTFSVSHDFTSDGSPVSQVAVSDTLAGALTRLSGDDGDGLLEDGESWVYVASYVIKTTDADPLTNTVTVTGQDQDSGPITFSADFSTDLKPERIFLPIVIK